MGVGFCQMFFFPTEIIMWFFSFIDMMQTATDFQMLNQPW